MPYEIEPRKSGYVVVNEITGRDSEPITKASSAQLRILKSVMNKPKTHRP